jgi:hypothetical protein
MLGSLSSDMAAEAASVLESLTTAKKADKDKVDKARPSGAMAAVLDSMVGAASAASAAAVKEPPLAHVMAAHLIRLPDHVQRLSKVRAAPFACAFVA